MSESFPAPDVRQLSDKDFPSGDFPADRRRDFRIAFEPDAHARILKHAAENLSVEVGGVLVGRWFRDEDGPFVVVSASIRAEATDSKFAEVTFTHESWARINREMDTRYSDQQIVGWYHSHPGFGIFLSERDEFIHQHFFSDPGQIALVVDPISKTEGVFLWRSGKPTRCEQFWVGDHVQVASQERIASSAGRSADRDERPDLSPARAVETPTSAGSPRKPQAEPDLSLASFGQFARALLPYVALFLLGFFIADRRDAWERRALVEGVAIHYGLWKGLRPGLRQCLDQLDANLEELNEAFQTLAAPPENASVEKSETQRRERLQEAQSRIQSSREFLRLMKETYCLDDTETAIVAALMAAKLAELQRIGQQRKSENATSTQTDRKSDQEEQRPTKPEPQQGESRRNEADQSATDSKRPSAAFNKAAAASEATKQGTAR
ncbi:MAG: hypothetical protein GXP27_15365 [Planctomycetes bacterium]|nr:hypothetical protein [Planctomycetota bacterium]